jgi:hypothetical protein
MESCGLCGDPDLITHGHMSVGTRVAFDQCGWQEEEDLEETDKPGPAATCWALVWPSLGVSR